MSPPLPTHSLGAVLERDRLERRVRRVTVAIVTLRRRASEDRREAGGSPRLLRRAIADFEAEIEAMNGRLRDLAPERPFTSASSGPASPTRSAQI
jgi:hypothetical protein